jgi:organic radical activating enzyme
MITLPVMEHFYTIQGEGAYTGHAAYFIRLGWCDVGCHWCDVKESWPRQGHPEHTVEEIVSWVLQTKAQIAVITGGEPLMHDLSALTTSLRNAGIRTHIETSGAHPLSGTWDWICLSPKKFKEPKEEIYSLVDELKVIVYNKSDLDYALQQQSKVSNQKSKFFLQAEWGKKELMYPLITEFVKNNPTWQISVQTHKYLQIP